jgi:hypothetical protein
MLFRTKFSTYMKHEVVVCQQALLRDKLTSERKLAAIVRDRVC